MNASTFTRRIAVLVAAAMAFSAFAGGAAAHTATDDHGTLTFHDSEDGEAKTSLDSSDRAELECEFWIRGHNMTHPNGTILAHHHLDGPSAHTHEVANWTGIENESGGWDFEVGPITLHEGGDWSVESSVGDSHEHQTNMHRIEYTMCEEEEEPEPPEEEPEVPMCPANVETTAHEDETVSLSWDASADADTYNVYRATASESFEHVAEVESTSFTDTETEADVTYQYRVTAANEAGESEACPVVEVTAIPVFGTPAIAALAAVGGVGAMMALRRRG